MDAKEYHSGVGRNKKVYVRIKKLSDCVVCDKMGSERRGVFVKKLCRRWKKFFSLELTNFGQSQQGRISSILHQ